MLSALASYLLLQSRNPGDPMLGHEVECFAGALGCDPSQIRTHDLIAGAPPPGILKRIDVVLLGGSGDHSVVIGGPWLEPALDVMRELHDRDIPTFASCWGFQAMAMAMGGEVVRDDTRAEVGTHVLHPTVAAADDPVFYDLPEIFLAQMGHHDIVERIPDDATLLASSGRVEAQAYRFDDRRIYCTQFHPELTCAQLLDRLRRYPQYLEELVGMTFDEFAPTCADTPEARSLLPGFVHWALS